MPTTVLQPADLIEQGEGVFYSAQPLPVVDGSLIERLKQAARTIPRRRARFCAHPSPEAKQHDMLIVSHRDTYVAPHRHHDKSETFLILEGFADFLLFSDDGRLEQVFKLGPLSSGRPFFYRMPPRRFHSLAIESELLVFVESALGPFRPDQMENAPWAPPPDDVTGGRAFIASAAAKSAG